MSLEEQLPLAPERDKRDVRLSFDSGRREFQQSSALDLAGPPWKKGRDSGDSAPKLPDLSQLLAAAKPIIWRGRSELVQLPWATPCAGLVLVIDLWAGLGGLLVALLSLGVRCIAVAAEMDTRLHVPLRKCFSNLVLVDKVEHLRGDDFLAALSRRSFAAIVIGGGSPCQGNSSLNVGRGEMVGPPDSYPAQLRRLVREFEQVVQGVPILSFIENVANIPGQVIQHYTELVGGPPVLIDAQSWGWTQRKRLFWLHGPLGGLPQSGGFNLPDGFELLGNKAQGEPCFTMSAPDSKPFPPAVPFAAGYVHRFDQRLVTAGLQSAFHTFTREFWHPPDRVKFASPEAVQRFFKDARRFPATSYEQNSLVWKGDKWRQLDPEERAMIHGMPPALLEEVIRGQDDGHATAVRNSVIGNGFHVPSLMLALLLLFQLAPNVHAAPQKYLPCVVEKQLQVRIACTEFDHVWVKSYPGILSVDEVLEDMQIQLPMVEPEHKAWKRTKSNLLKHDLACLQCFWVFMRRRGFPAKELGPFWAMQKCRAGTAAGLGTQRAAGGSKRGLDHMLQPGLGKDLHIYSARQAASPFSCQVKMDLDLVFAAELVAVLGPYAQAWRELQQKAMHNALVALQPLRLAVAGCRSATAEAVASRRDVPALAFITSILRWPDRTQARGYLEGFPVVGEIEASRVFRPLGPQVAMDLNSEFYGEAAIAEVEQVTASPPPKDAEEIWALTQEEIDKNFTEDLVTAAQMDARFGRGRWRPIHRFLVRQADGKVRLIDDGRRGKQNEFASLSETIYTIGIDTVPSVAALLVDTVRTVRRHDLGSDLPLPEWFRLTMGTDDLPDAFRGCPVLPEHQRAVVVAVWTPPVRAWRFGVMKGCPYGLGSVVVTFNRYPTLTTAFQRRVLGLLTGAYFDDVLLIDILCSSTQAKELCHWSFTILGTPPKLPKAFPMQSHRPFLGTVPDLSSIHEDGWVTVRPKEMSRKQVIIDIDIALEAGAMTSAQAAKTRGRSSWVASNTFGKIGRLGMAVLKELQYRKQGPLTTSQIRALRFHQHVVAQVPPRQIQVVHRERDVLILYSDAEYTPGSGRQPRLGWVLFPAAGQMPLGQTLLLPAEVTESWKVRKQQIFPAEAAALPIATWAMAAHLQGRDVVWFIDNEAAASAGIRGGSAESEVDIMMQVAHILWMRLSCRVWIEWVDSHSNPADGLSRLGLADPWTLTQNWHLSESREPPWSADMTGPGPLFQALWDDIGMEVA